MGAFLGCGEDMRAAEMGGLLGLPRKAKGSQRPMSEGDDVYSRFAENLARTERMSRSALNAYRSALLRRIVSFAHASAPFYRDRLAPLFHNGDTPDLQRWREVPILRRTDIERDIDRINPAALPPDIGEVAIRRSSGTTGPSGMTFRICAPVRIADACMMQRLYHWWSQRQGRDAMVLSGPSGAALFARPAHLGGQHDRVAPSPPPEISPHLSVGGPGACQPPRCQAAHGTRTQRSCRDQRGCERRRERPGAQVLRLRARADLWLHRDGGSCTAVAR